MNKAYFNYRNKIKNNPSKKNTKWYQSLIKKSKHKLCKLKRNKNNLIALQHLTWIFNFYLIAFINSSAFLNLFVIIQCWILSIFIYNANFSCNIGHYFILLTIIYEFKLENIIIRECNYSHNKCWSNTTLNLSIVVEYVLITLAFSNYWLMRL